VIGAHAGDELPVLAGRILASVGAYGKQFDDQTVLLVRRI
jgi:hypothetical protein